MTFVFKNTSPLYEKAEKPASQLQSKEFFKNLISVPQRHPPHIAAVDLAGKWSL